MAPLGAAALLSASIGVFLLVAGNPGAGLPSVTAKLSRGDAAAKPGAAGPAAASAEAKGPSVDSLGLFQDVTAPGFDAQDAPPVQGTAVITVPDGAGAPVAKGSVAALPAAPVAGVVQASTLGPMPVIAPDGRTPFSAYARPFKDDGHPKIALVVGGLGVNPAATRQAIEQLPPEITLSFTPYAEGLQGWIDLARAAGHEVMIEIPMEPVNYPDSDPGPYTLLADARPDDMLHRLDWLLTRAVGYFGVCNYQGSRFLKSDSNLSAFMSALKSKGLAFIDDGQALGKHGAWARLSAERTIDGQLGPDQINAQLQGLEASAKTRGWALGAGFAYPVTVQVAARWAAGLKAHGLQLAPVSALARKS